MKLEVRDLDNNLVKCVTLSTANLSEDYAQALLEKNLSSDAKATPENEQEAKRAYDMIPPELKELSAEIEAERMRKALVAYEKQLEYIRRWRVRNRERYNATVCAKMMEKYKSNAEYREKQKQGHRSRYYMTKYGVTEDEYKQQKEQKRRDVVEKYKRTDWVVCS